MTKHSKATFLPRKVQKNLEIMGEQIKLARKRRTLSLAVIAERAQCTQLTLMRVEKGSPTVSIGIYARVLYALGLDESILLLARDDEDSWIIKTNPGPGSRRGPGTSKRI